MHIKEYKMTNPLPEEQRSQEAKAGRDATIVGGNYIRTTNISLWVSFFVVGVVALGGLAWALNFAGSIRGSGNPQQAPQSSPASTK
jgi:hypothetical protein